MLRETLSQTDVLQLPLFAFLLFLATFVFVVVRVLARGKHDPQARAMAQLPLARDTETQNEP